MRQEELWDESGGTLGRVRGNSGMRQEELWDEAGVTLG